eukprot:4603363-Pleurochrysis_carterae.AAC.2
MGVGMGLQDGLKLEVSLLVSRCCTGSKLLYSGLVSLVLLPSAEDVLLAVHAAPWALLEVPVIRGDVCSVPQRLVVHPVGAVGAVLIEDRTGLLPRLHAVAVGNGRNDAIAGVLLLASLPRRVAETSCLTARASHGPCSSQVEAALDCHLYADATAQCKLLRPVQVIDLIGDASVAKLVREATLHMLLLADDCLDAMLVVVVLADAERHGLHLGENGNIGRVHGAQGENITCESTFAAGSRAIQGEGEEPGRDDGITQRCPVSRNERAGRPQEAPLCNLALLGEAQPEILGVCSPLWKPLITGHKWLWDGNDSTCLRASVPGLFDPGVARDVVEALAKSEAELGVIVVGERELVLDVECKRDTPFRRQCVCQPLHQLKLLLRHLPCGHQLLPHAQALQGQSK